MSSLKEQKMAALVELAKSQIGVHETGGENSGEIIEMYQRVIGRAEKEPWCIAFIQWCVRQIDLKFGGKTILLPTESSQMLWLKTPTSARIVKPVPGCIVVWTKWTTVSAGPHKPFDPTYVPQPKDIPLSIGHGGIVVDPFQKEGVDFVSTVEGNTSDSAGINRDGDGVFLKSRLEQITTGSMRTTGYLLPWV